MYILNWVVKGKRKTKANAAAATSGAFYLVQIPDVNALPPNTEQIPNRDQLLGMRMYKKMQKTYNAQASELTPS
jgi:hypothetical protein